MKKGSNDRDSEKLLSQLDQLHQLSAETLIKQWQASFGVAPPKKLPLLRHPIYGVFGGARRLL